MTTTRVILPISDNQGYSPDQVGTSLTLGDLLESIQEAIEEHGEEALVILANGQRYGAGFGRIASSYGGPQFLSEEEYLDGE